MAEMKTEKKSILDYLSKNRFLIPVYQRPYVWGEDECEQLWEDVYGFFDNRINNSDEKYFLGSVVMYQENGRQHIIDGQQRTTTLSLLIRALWTKATNHKDDHISRLTKELASCLWDMDEYDDKVVYFDERHLKSDVATDSDNKLLHNILSNQYRLDQEKIDTVIKKSHSNYEKNYLYFVKKLMTWLQTGLETGLSFVDVYWTIVLFYPLNAMDRIMP